MGIVFFREFKALFRSIKAVVCIAALALVSGIFLMVNNISTGYGGIQAVFSNMSLAAALAIPPVAASVFTDERKKETDVLLKVLPVTVTDVVIGKFLAVLAFFMIPTAVLAIYPIVLSLFGAESTAQGYIILIMFIAAEMFFIAFSMMISALSRKTWKATVVSYAVSVILFILGMTAALLDGFLEQVMRFVSPFRRFDPTVFDMFDLSSLLCYISFAALFIFAAVLGVKHSRPYTDKAKKARMRTAVIAAALAGITLGVNVGAVLLPESDMRIDISTNGIYRISEPTLEFLDGVDEDITVYLINPSAGEEKLHAYIRRYCEQSDRITLKEVDTTEDTEFLQKYGMTSNPSLYSLIVESGRRWRLVDSEEFYSYYHEHMGFMSPMEYIYYGTYYEQMYDYYERNGASSDDLSTLYDMIESLATESVYCFNPEEPITEAIEYVTASSIPTVYFADGHGEKNNSSNPVDITAIEDIPSHAALLIINDPDTDYSASEIAILQRYSDRGGKLLVLTSPDAAGMENLMSFMKGFGLSLETDTVSVDGDTAVTASVNTSADVFSGAPLTELEMLSGSSIVSSEIDELAYTPLLTVNVKSGAGEEEETVTKDLGMAVTKNNAAKLIWITGADTFNRDTSDMNDDEKTQYTYAAYCIQYSTLWLHTAFTSKLTFPTAKPYSTAMITVGTGASTMIGMIFIVIIPLGLAGAAFAARYIRKKRSKAVNNGE